MASSKRPPARRDPRSEDESAPPADDLGLAARRARTSAGGPSPSSHPESEFEALRSRYAEAETKRRRAEALAEGLAQRVSSLEAELRARAPSSAGDDGRRRLEARVGELESELRSAQQKLETTRATLGASETANAELDARLAKARAQLDAAEEAVLDAQRQASAVPEQQAELEAQRGARAAAEAEAQAAAERLRAASDAEAEAQRLLAAERARVAELVTTSEDGAAKRVEAENAARAAEAARADLAAKLATASSKLTSTEAKLATLQSLASELDQALQRERARIAEIEAGQRRAQSAALSSARDVIARLERHEEKLSGIRLEALGRALALMDEAGGVSGAHGIPPRATPSVPFSRPAAAVARATSAQTAPGAVRPGRAKSSRPSPIRPDRDAPVVEPAPALPATAEAPTPIGGTPRQPSTKRTMQGISLPRGAFGTDNKTPTRPPPAPAASDPDIEITVDDES